MNACASTLVGSPRRMARRTDDVRPGERGSSVVVEGAEQLLRYPENIVLPYLAYFLAAPTLCYQISYPRRHACSLAASKCVR